MLLHLLTREKHEKVRRKWERWVNCAIISLTNYLHNQDSHFVVKVRDQFKLWLLGGQLWQLRP